MSTALTALNDTVRDTCIQAHVGFESFVASVGERARQEEGQTAAEYMGILLLVATIIFALVKTVDIDKTISEAANGLVTDIAGGGKEGPR